MKEKYKLLESEDYLKDLVASIKKAKKQVYVLAMVIVADDVTQNLIDALKEASYRGVEVIVAADIFTYTELSGFFLTNSRISKRSRRTSKTVKDLRSAGIKFKWLGIDRNMILMGRTHTKLSIIDDVTYAFGGINLFDGGIDSYDYMIKSSDQILAKKLKSEFFDIINAEKHRRLHKSRKFEHNKDLILTDGGMIGESIIYKRAVMHAKDSKKIVLVSQYCPSGKLAKAILKVPDFEVYYNPMTNTNFMNSIINLKGRLTSGIETKYTKSKYLHAKFIIFYKNDGSKLTISGSHNFVFSSVLAGTREIALETSNPEIIKSLEKFIEKNLF